MIFDSGNFGGDARGGGGGGETGNGTGDCDNVDRLRAGYEGDAARVCWNRLSHVETETARFVTWREGIIRTALAMDRKCILSK
jgi:hypothetical protein